MPRPVPNKRGTMRRSAKPRGGASPFFGLMRGLPPVRRKRLAACARLFTDCFRPARVVKSAPGKKSLPARLTLRQLCFRRDRTAPAACSVTRNRQTRIGVTALAQPSTTRTSPSSGMPASATHEIGYAHPKQVAAKTTGVMPANPSSRNSRKCNS